MTPVAPPPRRRPHRPARLLALVALALSLGACAPGLTIEARLGVEADVVGAEVVPSYSGTIQQIFVPSSRPSGGVVVRHAGRRTFTIPPGHYPPRGECRVWRPERPPGRQDPPGRCGVLERRVPAGAYLVYG